jgi:hypothetical protein
MEDNNEAWTERGSGIGLGSKTRIGEIFRFGDSIGEFAVLVLGELLLFLKRKFPKINANR